MYVHRILRIGGILLAASAATTALCEQHCLSLPRGKIGLIRLWAGTYPATPSELAIVVLAEIRLADAIDAGQESGEVQRHGDVRIADIIGDAGKPARHLTTLASRDNALENGIRLALFRRPRPPPCPVLIDACLGVLGRRERVLAEDAEAVPCAAIHRLSRLRVTHNDRVCATGQGRANNQ